MPRDYQGNGHHYTCNEQLPVPKVVLEKESYSRKYGGDNATNGLWPEMENDACHETAHTTQETDEGEEALPIDIDKSHGETAETTGKANEDPHHQNDVLVECAMARAFVVLIEEIHHQRGTHQGDAQPKPTAPVLVPNRQRHKLQEQHDGRGIAPG